MSTWLIFLMPAFALAAVAAAGLLTRMLFGTAETDGLLSPARGEHSYRPRRLVPVLGDFDCCATGAARCPDGLIR